MNSTEQQHQTRLVHEQTYYLPQDGISLNKAKRPYYRVKRFIDLILSLGLLILLSPLFIVIAILIKLDSPGPVIFQQERVGYDWRRQRIRNFIFYKFRSMVQNADQTIHQNQVKAWVRGEMYDENGSKDNTKVVNDPRVTRVGKYLRMTSLDELPQLWNVLWGTMSLVGPRPVPTYEVAEYDTWHYQRLEAPAGITGLWQVRGRGQVSLDEMARLDIEYIKHQSIGLDIQIIILTIPAVLSKRGAK